ncbi:MAG: hypothetical protein ACOCVF_02470 [bacterium]
MGSILTKIYDDYDTYIEFCKLVNEQPVNIENFIDHETELMKKHNYVRHGCWYKKLEDI